MNFINKDYLTNAFILNKEHWKQFIIRANNICSTKSHVSS